MTAFCNLAPIGFFWHYPITSTLSFIATQGESLMICDMQWSDIMPESLKEMLIFWKRVLYSIKRIIFKTGVSLHEVLIDGLFVSTIYSKIHK